MKENEEIILQDIEKLLNRIGWHFFTKPYRIDNKKWQFIVLPDGEVDANNKRFFIVTISPGYLSVSFEKKELHKRGNSKEILGFIESCLMTR